MGNLVYVCDTENNLIKCLDMETKMVSTVARAPGPSLKSYLFIKKIFEMAYAEFLVPDSCM